jgi:hypothetical protein
MSLIEKLFTLDNKEEKGVEIISPSKQGKSDAVGFEPVQSRNNSAFKVNSSGSKNFKPSII